MAVKHEDTFSDHSSDSNLYNDQVDEGDLEDSESIVFWEILNLDPDAKIDWGQPSIFTESIAGYENVFKQDLDDDGK